MTLTTTYRIQIKGLVQGVGFRPFIYRVAHHHQLSGWVENRNDGVLIEVNCTASQLDSLLDDIRDQAPRASNISSIIHEMIDEKEHAGFRIVKSSSNSDAVTDVSPDIAVCQACLDDMDHQKHRLHYPFINCTNCGPRFSIIRDLPYDRHKTTMEPFVLCDTCRSEYEDVLDRRFHAQPVACAHCGPHYELISGKSRVKDFNAVLARTTTMIESGKIVAMKGIGGFQMACDASNEATVSRLRKLKNREGKPFAVMFRNLQAVLQHTTLFPEERNALESWRRPIVLVSSRNMLAPSVSVGFPTVGAMLPYMPFHYLLFEHLKCDAVVLTSGNISDEPIVIDNAVAETVLTQISDAVLVYNRDIHNRTDDSVVFAVNEKERLIRRSRGYSPEPINLSLNTEGIFAAGAELVSCFALGKGRQAILSQHIGDLKNLETLDFYTESFERYKKLFRVKPTLVVHDKHPDYLSTKFARDLGLPSLEVQHHHAHIASGMAEHGLDEAVIGVSMDGTGLGDDSHIWGGEFLVCDLLDYERITHFEYVPMPGGDQVTKEPWRSGIAYLNTYFGDQIFDRNFPFLKEVGPQKTGFILQVLEKNINCPLSSSAGRLFDAVAALLGICTVSKFHAEAPMRLEAIAHPGIEDAYPFDFDAEISFKATFDAMLQDLDDGQEPGVIAARFHNTVIHAIFAGICLIRQRKGINKVVLSGGTFQNKYLLSRLEKKLQANGFELYAQYRVPVNDGGIALGQLAIAAKHRATGKTLGHL